MQRQWISKRKRHKTTSFHFVKLKIKNDIKDVTAGDFISEAEATVALNAAAEHEFKAILVSTATRFW